MQRSLSDSKKRKYSVPHLDIVVVNWNSGDQLLRCLDSISEFGEGYVSQCIVVDNGSSDNSEVAAERLLNCSVIRLGENVGFGRACNVGAQRASSPWLLFLNPDAALMPGCLARVFEFLENDLNARVGVCGAQLLDENGRVSRTSSRFPTPLGLVAGSLGFRCYGHMMTEWDHSETRDVDHVIGGFYLVRRDLFESLKGFDEQFFVYLEDLDLSYRIRREGWRITYLAQAQAFHLGGGVSRQVKGKRLFYSLRSKILYAFKHFSPVAALAVLLVTILVEPLSRCVFAVATGSKSGLGDTREAYLLLWRWLPQWLLKGVTR